MLSTFFESSHAFNRVEMLKEMKEIQLHILELKDKIENSSSE